MENSKHLLVIRLSAMGDVAMTVPVLKALEENYPELKITFLTRAFFKPMFSGLKNVKVYEADVKGKHKGLLGLWKLYKELKAMEFDAVIDLHNVLRSNVLKQYFKLGDIPFYQLDKGRKEKKELTAKKIQSDIKQLKTTHQRYADVFISAGFPLTLNPKNTLERIGLTATIIEVLGGNTSKWIGIAPFAAFDGKMYPLHLMHQVVEYLSSSNKYQVLLFGGGVKEKEVLSSWASSFQNTHCLVGEFPFAEELTLISNLDLMVSMDSGNAHLAAMFGIPTVTLWGITHPFAGFAPFGQNPEYSLLSDRKKYPLIPTSVYGNKVPQGYESVMETITPDSVIKKVEELVL